MRNRRRQYPDWPVKDLYVTFRKADRTLTSEANMLAIPRKQRAMVRKGRAEGAARRRSTRTPTQHYDIYSESLRNLGTPVFSKRYLEILQDACSATPATS